MKHDLRTLFWLQGRLLRNALRRKNVQDSGRLVGIASMALLALPGIMVMAVFLGIGLRLLTPQEAGEVLALVFVFILFIWLATPASNQQFVEPVDIPKLLHLPVGFRSLVMGSVLLNSASTATLVTLPFLIAIVAGASRRGWDILPIAISCCLFLGVLIIIKSLLDDIIDLAAEDRRLRLLIILLSLTPVLLIYFGQLSLQTRFVNPQGRSEVDDPRQLLAVISFLRYLRYVPPGWIAESILGAATAAWSRWLQWNLAQMVFIIAGLLLHVWLMRKIYFGELLRTAMKVDKRTATLRQGRRLPFLSPAVSADLLTLLRKDWLNFRRSPMTARLFFLPIMVGFVSYFFSLTPMPAGALGLIISGFAVFMVTMMAHNQIAAYDHTGVATLVLSPAPRHLVLISYALINLAVVLVMALIGGAVAAIRTGDILVLLVTLGVALIAQTALNGLTHLTSLVFPYYVDLERGQAAAGEAKASFFTVITTFVGAPILAAPIYLTLVLAGIAAPAYLPFALAFVAIYAVVAYAGQLFLATRLFPDARKSW